MELYTLLPQLPGHAEPFAQLEAIQFPSELNLHFSAASQHFNVNFLEPSHSMAFVTSLSPAITSLCADMKGVILTLNRHEELLQEMYEMVKVIEVETRRLNPDAIHDITDAAEAGLNDILNTIQEGRFLPPPSPEIDRLLSQAIERKKSFARPSSPTSSEGLVDR